MLYNVFMTCKSLASFFTWFNSWGILKECKWSATVSGDIRVIHQIDKLFWIETSKGSVVGAVALQIWEQYSNTDRFWALYNRSSNYMSTYVNDMSLGFKAGIH